MQHLAAVAASQLQYLAPGDIGRGERTHPVRKLVAGVNGAGWQVVPGVGKGIGGSLIGQHESPLAFIA
ncbi:hypothetical protein D3C85_1133830 [compost metagenome]